MGDQALQGSDEGRLKEYEVQCCIARFFDFYQLP